jgi:hypothetical protein
MMFTVRSPFHRRVVHSPPQCVGEAAAQVPAGMLSSGSPVEVVIELGGGTQTDGLAAALGSPFVVTTEATGSKVIVLHGAGAATDLTDRRRRNPGALLVVIAAPGATEHGGAVEAFHAGADDYLVAPSPEELAVHLSALARRRWR